MKRRNRRSAEKRTKTENNKSAGLDESPSKPSDNNSKMQIFDRAKRALKEPRLPSSVILPKNAGLINNNLDDASLLAEIRKRISDQNAHTIKVSPVPKSCSPNLLQDLCPASVGVRTPSGRSRRYAFIEFRTSADAEAAAKEVTGSCVNGKAIKAIVCSQRLQTKANWVPPTERGLEAFDLTTLYVSCLPRLTERTTLAQVFHTADNIKYESFPDGTSKGFCVLKYRNRKLAQRAFMERHGTLLRGTPIFVNFLIKPKKSEAKETVKKEVAPHGTLKHEELKGGEATVRPKTKRRRESANFESDKFVDVLTAQCRTSGGDKADRKGKDAALPVEANECTNFSIKYSEGPKPKKARLQPYQLSKRKSGNRKKKPKNPNK
ncbi:nucleolin [Taenia crassiceps]|uniref:Nucleolin n=1 Tax=Taenia crassiceps TaxID=6207 RepID=A0ABR4QF35_9CEST